jgi:DNA-directed RNA polymerase specialized sigma24 family protein
MKTAKTVLIEAATVLRRKVRASLPWGVRLGSLLFNLRFAADPATFGNVAYGVFHILGVEGLPRTSFTPSTIREIDRLPRDYGLEFGNRAQYIARKYLHQEDDVEEVLSLVAMKLISNQSLGKCIQGKNVRDAENYVLRAVQNLAIDFLRTQKAHRYEEITDLLREPNSWKGLEELIPEAEQERIKQELEDSVSPRMPDLPLYFDLLLDGYSNKSIAEERMLPSLQERPISQQALAKYRDKIKNVLRQHFEVQSADHTRWASQCPATLRPLF